MVGEGDNVPYVNEARQILKDLFYEDWMDDNDWEEFRETLFHMSGMSDFKIAGILRVGVERGYPIEKQIKLAKSILQGGKQNENT